MFKRQYDYLILGQGIAGSCVAWELWRRGKTALIVDREESVTTSRVAAGLMTPVTGQRLVPSWKFHQFREVAIPFYREIEVLTQSEFYREFRMLRIFQQSKEKELFLRKKEELKSYVENDPNSPPSIDSTKLEARWGGFEMPLAGQLRTVPFLDATRNFFRERDLFLTGELDLSAGLKIIPDQPLQFPGWGVSSNRLICCQGFSGSQSDWLTHLPWKPAKGEILTLRISGLDESRILNAGLWVIPLGQDLYRVGSTYEWHQLDQIPTETGREEICRRLRSFLKLPFEIVDHQAAVRPSMENQKPVVGCLPEEPRIAFLNGLGSKGALMGPLLAQQLIDHLERGTALDPEIDLTNK
ncbi:MAG: FAD-dependent oxidoreductase [Planctomycetaceae bacterium]